MALCLGFELWFNMTVIRLHSYKLSKNVLEQWTESLNSNEKTRAANDPSVFTITEKAFSLLLIENEEPPWLWKSMDLEQWKESLNSSEKTEYSPPSLSSLSLQFLVMVLSLSQPGPECFSLSVSSLVTSCSRAGGCEYNGGPGAHQSSSLVLEKVPSEGS